MHLLGVSLGVAPERFDLGLPRSGGDGPRFLEQRSELLQLAPVQGSARKRLRVQLVDVGLTPPLVSRDATLLGVMLALDRERRAHGRNCRRRRAADLDETRGLLIPGSLPRRLHLVTEPRECALAHREDRPAHCESLALALLDELAHPILLCGERRSESDAQTDELLARGLLVAASGGADSPRR